MSVNNMVKHSSKLIKIKKWLSVILNCKEGSAFPSRHFYSYLSFPYWKEREAPEWLLMFFVSFKVLCAPILYNLPHCLSLGWYAAQSEAFFGLPFKKTYSHSGEKGNGYSILISCCLTLSGSYLWPVLSGWVLVPISGMFEEESINLLILAQTNSWFFCVSVSDSQWAINYFWWNT